MIQDSNDAADQFVDSVVMRDVTGNAPDFSAADIDFIRQHPEVLDKLADPLEIKRRYLYVLFVVAVAMAATSKIVEYTDVLEGSRVAHDLLTNVLFSVSIELFGAATVAVLLELVFEKRIQRNQALVRSFVEQEGRRGRTTG